MTENFNVTMARSCKTEKKTGALIISADRLQQAGSSYQYHRHFWSTDKEGPYDKCTQLMNGPRRTAVFRREFLAYSLFGYEPNSFKAIGGIHRPSIVKPFYSS